MPCVFYFRFEIFAVSALMSNRSAGRRVGENLHCLQPRPPAVSGALSMPLSMEMMTTDIHKMILAYFLKLIAFSSLRDIAGVK